LFYPWIAVAAGSILHLVKGQRRVLLRLGFQERLNLLQGGFAAVGFQKFFLLARLGGFNELRFQFLACHDLAVQFLNGFHTKFLPFSLYCRVGLHVHSADQRESPS